MINNKTKIIKKRVKYLNGLVTKEEVLMCDKHIKMLDITTHQRHVK